MTKSAVGHFPIGSKGPINGSGRQLGTRLWQRRLGGFPKPRSRREVSPLVSHRQGWTLLSVISSLGRTGFLRHNENSRTAHMRQQLDCQPYARQRQGQCSSSPTGVHTGGPTALPLLSLLFPHQSLLPILLPSHLDFQMPPPLKANILREYH